jgi:hypothetical protein
MPMCFFLIRQAEKQALWPKLARYFSIVVLRVSELMFSFIANSLNGNISEYEMDSMLKWSLWHLPMISYCNYKV